MPEFIYVVSLLWFIVTDSRVMYSEPAKFVAKLRDTKTDDNVLLFNCELGAGHCSKSGRSISPGGAHRHSWDNQYADRAEMVKQV
ncbi:unnamed protein product [Ilex paraguariensis]|uniref:Peptidase S9 prolyl oligopeptidase catalytic domain-containing protein n=1 Tax=Ilex paraguariensis TaxID=185542 RepID=A0ABC8RK52_9AQUA